jgi:hypothetical protein
VSRHPGHTVVSHEAFVRCTPEQAARAVRELGETHEVHVVVTARDLARSLVSAWLEGLKHGTEHDLAEHLARAEAGTLPVMRSLDLPAVLGIWLAELGADRISLVTVPPAGAPGSLWPRFCHATGIDEGAAPREVRARNDAVGVAEAQLLLALNRRLGADLARGGRLHAAARRTVVAALNRRGHDPVRLGAEETSWLTERAGQWSAWVASSGVRVVGDLVDLLPVPVPDAVSPDWSTPHPDVVDAAAAALHAALDEVARS